MKYYDIVIIGGGIAGIYTMYNLKKKYPNLKVLLLEKEDRYGGRIYTFHKHLDGFDYIMDLGAGRIGYHHELMVSLIKELKLEKDMISITNTKNYIEIDKTKKISVNKSDLKQKYSKLLYNLFKTKIFQNIPKLILKKLYLYEILSQIFTKKDYKNIENSFEYNNKLYYLNSYDAINYFKYDYNPYSKFFIMKNGYYSIINKMIESISQNKNYKLKKNTYVNNITYNIEESKYMITYKSYNSNNNSNNSNNSNSNNNVYCNHLICAIPRCDLIKFNILKEHNKYLNTINEISKVRIFEIYDKNKANKTMWFKNISKTTTNNELQFVIPINAESGLIMSSYNENLSTQNNYWYELYKKNKKSLKQILQKKLQQVFNLNIPESKYIKLYYWQYGVACWKKNVDSQYISQKIINLMPNFYICGENYSQYQAWCEGALLSSNQVLKTLYCKIKNEK